MCLYVVRMRINQGSTVSLVFVYPLIKKLMRYILPIAKSSKNAYRVFAFKFNLV